MTFDMFLPPNNDFRIHLSDMFSQRNVNNNLQVKCGGCISWDYSAMVIHIKLTPKAPAPRGIFISNSHFDELVLQGKRYNTIQFPSYSPVLLAKLGMHQKVTHQVIVCHLHQLCPFFGEITMQFDWIMYYFFTSKNMQLTNSDNRVPLVTLEYFQV